MVDPPGQDAKDNAQGTIFNSDIGDDWGEAFAAEEFMASPTEEASHEFFLPEDIAETAIPGPTTLAGEKPDGPPAASPPPSLFHSLTVRFRQLPVPRRLATVAAPIAGLILLLFLTLHRSPKTPSLKTEALPKSAATSHLPEEPVSHPQPSPTIVHEVASKSKALTPTAIPAETRTIHKKWRFPAVIALAKSANGQPPSILTADLTLVLNLTPEIMPPAERDSFVREILYQFYTNQPPEDLKRYTIERGEMSRKLKGWIIKQWPGLPLDSITIDRYELL